MNKIKAFTILFLVSFALVLAGCSASIEEEAENTISLLEETFSAEPTETNTSNDEISYYLPNSMEIESEQDNNLIIKEGKQTFILFVNQIEEKDSKVMYESIIEKVDENVLEETFEDDNRFGYTIVQGLEDNLYEVTVGIGGVKMTTEAKANSVSESAELMMEIVSSVTY